MKKIVVVSILFCSLWTIAQTESFKEVKDAINDENYDKCLLLLEALSKSEKESINYYHLKTFCEFYMMNFDTAIWYADKGISMEKVSDTLLVKLYYLKSNAYYELENYPLAIETINKALIINPSSYEFYALKGAILFLQNNIDESLKTLEEALSNVLVNYDIIYNNLSYISLENGDYSNAIQYADAGLALTSDKKLTGTLLNNKGFAIGLSLDVAKGIEMVKKSLEYFPENSYAYYNIGILNISIDNYPIACENFLLAKEFGARDMKNLIDDYCK